VSDRSTASPHSQDGLRSWQAAALQTWQEAGRRGIVEVATGGGKTRFAIACIGCMEQERSIVSTIVVPTTALADQWYVSLMEDGDAEPSEVTVLSSRAKEADLRRFNVVVINSARSIDPGIWPENRVLVVDEVHRAGSVENAKALRGSALATLGLSATPERQYDNALDEVLVPALGPLIFRYSLQDASRDGILSEFALTNVVVSMSEDEHSEYDRLTKQIARSSGHHQDDERVLALLRRRSRVAAQVQARIPAAVHLAEINRGSRQIVFHESIASAEDIYNLLRSRGHSATIYHSKMGPQLRRENLRLFRRGVYDTLVTCRALDEGVNVPEVQVAVVAAATASERQRIQRLGRVLRPAEGKGLARIYTLVATGLEEQRLREEESKLEGVAEVTWLRAALT
jgi:superfamily II DNA or RNA helicase